MKTYTFPIHDGILKLTFFADNGVRVIHSLEGQEPQTLTGLELPRGYYEAQREASQDRRHRRQMGSAHRTNPDGPQHVAQRHPLLELRG